MEYISKIRIEDFKLIKDDAEGRDTLSTSDKQEQEQPQVVKDSKGGYTWLTK